MAAATEEAREKAMRRYSRLDAEFTAAGGYAAGGAWGGGGTESGGPAGGGGVAAPAVG